MILPSAPTDLLWTKKSCVSIWSRLMGKLNTWSSNRYGNNLQKANKTVWQG